MVLPDRRVAAITWKIPFATNFQFRIQGMHLVQWKLDQRIPSDPNRCAPIVEMLLAQLAIAGWGNKDTFGIHMAMEEAIMNAIRHGNECCDSKEVQIVVEIGDKTFYARITDEGCGFDLSDVPDPTADENLDKSSGRGVALIKHFVDQVIYNEVGNSVELRKQKST